MLNVKGVKEVKALQQNRLLNLMDRNTFTGLFLILIILVGSTFLMQPSDEDIKKEINIIKDQESHVQIVP